MHWWIPTCSERRNITILIPNFLSFKKLFEVYLQPLIKNDACFTLNSFSYGQDQVIQLKETSNYQIHEYSTDFDLRVKNFIKRLAKDGPMSDGHVKQTLVLNVGYDEFEDDDLEKLQDDKKWDIILFCFLRCSWPETVYEWLPFHRIVIFDLYQFYFDSYLKDLVDVIKNPDYNRYQFLYKSVLHDDKYFNESCMKHITEIHVRAYDHIPTILLFYVAVAKENERRKITKEKPLELRLVYTGRPVEVIFRKLSQEFSEENVRPVRLWFRSNYDSEIKNINTRREKLFLILPGVHGEDLKDKCKSPAFRKQIRYGLPSKTISIPEECRPYKMIEYPNDTLDMINNDICRNSN